MTNKRIEGTLSLDNPEQDRSTRESASRNSDMRKTDSYVPASQLPTPEPRDGWEHRWIRTANFDKADNRNLSRRFREGWEPIKISEYPELEHEVSDVGSKYPDGLEIGGLLLCKCPSEIVGKRRDYQRNQSVAQMTAVNSGFMNEQDPRMPKYNESTSRTQFRKG